MLITREMETFGFLQCIFRRLDLNRNISISQKDIDFGSTCCPPEGNREIQLAVMTLGPAFLNNKVFKCVSIMARKARIYAPGALSHIIKTLVWDL
jgi:hypothetical protein